MHILMRDLKVDYAIAAIIFAGLFMIVSIVILFYFIVIYFNLVLVDSPCLSIGVS
jgi:fumarate reductase subunit D